MSILTATLDYRAELDRREAAAMEALHAAYRSVWQALETEAMALATQIDAARAAGEEIGPSWLYRQERYRILLAQAQAEITRISSALGPTLTQLQAEAVALGTNAAQGLLVDAGVQVAVRLPNDQLIDLVGRLSDGSPLSTLLDELPGDAGERIRTSLVNGIGTGQHPSVIARGIRDALGGNMARAERIARTEAVSSYRNANLRTFEAHRNLLAGWVWSASITNTNPRPCAMCLANHGTVHPVDEPFASHPSCRCVASPLVKGRQPFESGEAWFAKQPVAVQLEVLGPSKFAAYQGGKIQLADLVDSGTDQQWGPWQREASLRQALGASQAREYYQ